MAAWRALNDPGGTVAQPPAQAMPPALPLVRGNAPPGYRRIGRQALRIDMAEKLLREAHAVRVAAGARPFPLDPARAVSMGLTEESYLQLLRLGGFQPRQPRSLPDGAFGPPAPVTWRWRPPRRQAARRPAPPAARHGAFAALAELVR